MSHPSIELVPVQSSNVAALGYDATAGVLRVRFKSGATYDYEEVPADVAEALNAAESKGRFVATVIKGRFACTKLPAEPVTAGAVG